MSSKSSPRASRWDVVIVGGGIGGLTVGALLAQSGARVVVCEQHIRAGGYCHSWSRLIRHVGERIPLTFDAAVHDISGAFPNGPIRTILNRLGLADRFEWHRLSHEYCISSARFLVDEDPEAYIETLKRHFPKESAGIDHFFRAFRKSYDELYHHAALTGGIPRAPLPREMRRFREHCPTLMKFVGVPFVEFRDSLLRDAELRQVVSILSAYVSDDVRQLSFMNMLPLFGYYFRGGYYPRGGSQALADALAQAVAENGGQVCLGTPIVCIRIAYGRVAGVVLADGTELNAPVVISNADPEQTFGRLIKCNDQSRQAMKTAGFRPSNSAFLVYLALDSDPAVAHSTFVIDDSDGVIISRPPFGADRVPEKYTTLTLTGLVSADACFLWDRGAARYRERKREAGDHLIAFATRRIPNLLDHIIYREEGSPATLQRYTWSTGGAAYGATPDTRWPGHQTPVSGLYMVGATTGQGPGIEAVMVGAASLAEHLGWSSSSAVDFDSCRLADD
jgi:phytoene dehydrogenase-like protein